MSYYYNIHYTRPLEQFTTRLLNQDIKITFNIFKYLIFH